MPASKALVSRRNLAEARALCSEMAIEPSCAPSMRAKATRFAPESTTATFSFQPRLFDSATAALIAACAWPSEIGVPYGMSFGILSGTTSIGLGCCGCCAIAPNAATALQIASNARIDDMLPPLVDLRNAKQLVQGLNSGGGDLLVFVRLHPRDADRADACAVDHDRQAALHRRHAGHADQLGPRLDALLPVGGGAARLGGGGPLLHPDARLGRGPPVHARGEEQMPPSVPDPDSHVSAGVLRPGI